MLMGTTHYQSRRDFLFALADALREHDIRLPALPDNAREVCATYYAWRQEYVPGERYTAVWPTGATSDTFPAIHIPPLSRTTGRSWRPT